LFNPDYWITLMDYLCSQWTPNVQIKCFMFYWSIYRLFALNRRWKRDLLQMMIFVNICPNQVFYVWYKLFMLNRGWKSEYLQIVIFVHVCSTGTLVELKTRFETWITRKNVNVAGLFHLSYLITLMAYL
jgi:hypothetical protein